jgi:hypothetical protein
MALERGAGWRAVCTKIVGEPAAYFQYFASICKNSTSQALRNE